MAAPRVRRRKVSYPAASVIALAMVLGGCGSSGGSFANKARPPSPVNLTVYINNARVSVSPTSVGAGPVVFIVTNQASKTVSVMINSALNGGGGSALATTGPINPQATATVTVDFHDPGDYVLNTSTGGQTQAQQAQPPSITPATVHVGNSRPSGSNELLQP